MKCTHCNKEIVLVPSAAERAAKDVTGKSAAYYTSLFQMHSSCQLELRAAGVSKLMAESKSHD